MKKQCIRLFSLLAALILVLGTVPALAEGEWACPNCGKADNTGNFCSNCGAARPAEAPEAPLFNDQLEQIPGETDCVKVLVYSVDAHDYIVAKDPMRWYFTNAVDGNEKTCWQFSSAKEGVLGNAWLEMALASPQTVDSLWILPGNRNNDTSYNNNARPRSIRVEFLYAGDTEYTETKEFVLKDDLYLLIGWQKLELGHHENVERVRVRILSQNSGAESYNDVCLAEVMLVQYADPAIALPAGAGAVPQAIPSETGALPLNPIYDLGTVTAKLLMRLSTRSGPDTEYSSTGTFFQDNWAEQTVQVLGKTWDDSNGIWWVLVDFADGGARYRVWTGVQRVDVNLDEVPDYPWMGYGVVYSTAETRQGPGGAYAKGKAISGPLEAFGYGRENGYVEVEYYDSLMAVRYRVWVPESAVSITWH